MSHIKLKTCPFCGGEELGVREVWKRGSMFWVVCGSCGASSDLLESEEKAAEAWNRRDGRTCLMTETDHEFEDSVRCSACGQTFRRPWEQFRFCPNCGAVVIPHV